jgi:hypothetical protein
MRAEEPKEGPDDLAQRLAAACGWCSAASAAIIERAVVCDDGDWRRRWPQARQAPCRPSCHFGLAVLQPAVVSHTTGRSPRTWSLGKSALKMRSTRQLLRQLRRLLLRRRTYSPAERSPDAVAPGAAPLGRRAEVFCAERNRTRLAILSFNSSPSSLSLGDGLVDADLGAAVTGQRALLQAQLGTLQAIVVGIQGTKSTCSASSTQETKSSCSGSWANHYRCGFPAAACDGEGLRAGVRCRCGTWRRP